MDPSAPPSYPELPYTAQAPQPNQVGPPVMLQPQPTNTTVNVVMQQPIQKRDWSTGLCSCCDDCGVCCCYIFCTCCVLKDIAEKQGENCCTACCVPGGVIALRTKLRVTRGIQGSICNDCCMWYWCGPCVVCQMARELK